MTSLRFLYYIFELTYHILDEVVQTLLKRKANINARDKEGATALHKAAFVGDTKVLATLMKKGADLNAKDNAGATPLHKVGSHWQI